MTDVQAAARVLAEAAAIDPTMPKPDPVIAVNWAKALSKYDLPLPLMIEAVIDHYADETRRIMPADVTRLGRKIRADRSARESSVDRDRRALHNDRRLELTSGRRPATPPGPASPTRRAEVMAAIRSFADRKAVRD
ncbi:hypothetical protein C1M55_28285 [Rhodococcus qingshengii]|uniref:hypothetical protein n=1 Tax=Rhodococcus TaxID=1827 RepID=UPI000C9FA378|nr:hypothetical protein [Rhodococcus qingshengii]AUS34630.1 hypothetical protein C1M55_28285 [Rhodococcus qingshengii]